MTPIFANLVAASLHCSGFNTLLCCGLFNGFYSRRNLDPQKDISVQQTVRYLSYLMRQISYLLIGIITPFLMLDYKIGLFHGCIAVFYNFSMVLIVWMLSIFVMPILSYSCQPANLRNDQ